MTLLITTVSLLVLFVSVLAVPLFCSPGTSSILVGAHQFLIHPWFVALGWWKLYGFPWDPRLWVAFFVHDLGYWGKPNMDGPEGETHPLLGANIMSFLFDDKRNCPSMTCHDGEILGDIDFKGRPHWTPCPLCSERRSKWYNFTLYHSRFYSKRHQAQYSRLCVADKMAIAMIPRWLYILLSNLSGEIEEYMFAEHARSPLGIHGGSRAEQQWTWITRLQAYILRWCAEHKDLKPDEWTNRAPVPIEKL